MSILIHPVIYVEENALKIIVFTRVLKDFFPFPLMA